MNGFLSVAVLGAACTVQVLGGAEPTAPEPEAVSLEGRSPAELVASLGHERYAVREAASKRLKDLGPRAYRALRSGISSADTEVSTRSSKLIGLIRFNIIDYAFKWLAVQQEADGHWDSRKHGARTNRDIQQTALAVLALLSCGHTEKTGEFKDCAGRAIAWLRAQQRKDGTFVEAGETEPHPEAQAMAGWALAEAAGMSKEPETVAAAQLALDASLAQFQIELEGKERWGFKLSPASEPTLAATALFAPQVRAAEVSALKGPVQSREGAGRFVWKCLAPDKKAARRTPEADAGPEQAWTVCFAFRILRVDWQAVEPLAADAFKESGAARQSLEKLDGRDLYTATFAAFNLGGQAWVDWNTLTRAHLYDTGEIGEGSCFWLPNEAEKDSGRVYATALRVMALAIYYRYLPTYK